MSWLEKLSNAGAATDVVSLQKNLRENQADIGRLTTEQERLLGELPFAADAKVQSELDGVDRELRRAMARAQALEGALIEAREAEAVNTRAEQLAQARACGDTLAVLHGKVGLAADELVRACQVALKAEAEFIAALPPGVGPIERLDSGRRLILRLQFGCPQVFGPHGTMLDVPELERAIDLPAVAKNHVAGIIKQAEDAPVVAVPSPVETESPAAETKEVAARE